MQRIPRFAVLSISLLILATAICSAQNTLLNSGNVGVGTATPAYKLDVNGTMRVTGNFYTGSLYFADGTVQSTAWSGAVCGADYAEMVELTGTRSSYAPGDVLVVDPVNPGSFVKSSTPYSTTVAGVYSTKPGVVGKRTTDPEKLREQVPMAMVGIVPMKVSAENGPIQPGDLLVTSTTPGHAMKGTDRIRMVGAIVGKAMAALSSGSGTIEALVSLQ